MEKFTINARIWIYPSETASWHFVTIPKITSERIRSLRTKKPRGWGSMQVEAKIGNTKWNTSIFPDSKSGTFIIPIKASVRKIEGIYVDDLIKLFIALIP